MALVLYINPVDKKTGKVGGTIYQSTMYGEVIASAGTAGYVDTAERRKMKNILHIVAQAWKQQTETNQDSFNSDLTATINTFHTWMERNIGMLMSKLNLAINHLNVRPFLFGPVFRNDTTDGFIFNFFFSEPETGYFCIMLQTKWFPPGEPISNHYVRQFTFAALPSGNEQRFINDSSNIFLPPPGEGYRCRFRAIAINPFVAPFIFNQHFILLAP